MLGSVVLFLPQLKMAGSWLYIYSFNEYTDRREEEEDCFLALNEGIK
jgi:hypothetical protein